jgi:hypothetical protein
MERQASCQAEGREGGASISLIANKSDFFAGLRAAVGEHERRVAQRVREITYHLHVEITHATPVWSGAALANYQWSAGAPIETIIEPIGEGHPGHTNEMPIGPEPRRAANQASADASFAAVDFSNPYRVFWLNNNAPHIAGLEYGEYPPPPANQRSPQGMFARALNVVVTKLEARML